jgi:tetratricopeptide (TPR) repeat protein
MLLKMKYNQLKISLCFVVMLLLPALCFADDMQSAFEKGNSFYNKNHYKEAISAYTQIINSGNYSAPVYFNLGNAYYKDGDLPSALLYYEKAHRLSPGDDDINFNIRFANARTTDKIDDAPEFFLSKWWKGFMLAISANALAIIAIVLILLGSGTLILYFFSSSFSVKKVSFFVALVLFFLGIFAVSIAGSQVSYFNDNKQAIIFTSVVNVKSSPAQKAATLFVLHDGTKVNISDNSNGWLKIKLANGNEGWLKLADVKEI